MTETEEINVDNTEKQRQVLDDLLQYKTFLAEQTPEQVDAIRETLYHKLTEPIEVTDSAIISKKTLDKLILQNAVIEMRVYNRLDPYKESQQNWEKRKGNWRNTLLDFLATIALDGIEQEDKGNFDYLNADATRHDVLRRVRRYFDNMSYLTERALKTTLRFDQIHDELFTTQSDNFNNITNRIEELDDNIEKTKVRYHREALSDFSMAGTMHHEDFKRGIKHVYKKIYNRLVTERSSAETLTATLEYANFTDDDSQQRNNISALAESVMVGNSRYIGAMKARASVRDMKDLRAHTAGLDGKIGGKGSGTWVANIILQESLGAEYHEFFIMPEFFHIDDTIYDAFLFNNDLTQAQNIKYDYAKALDSNDEKEIQHYEVELELMQQRILKGEFPEWMQLDLRDIFERFAKKSRKDKRSLPHILRSSSRLEDGELRTFAGVYDSIFQAPIPDSHTDEDGFEASFELFCENIKKLYAQTLSKNALQYRYKHGLINEDEKMSILWQPLIGEIHEQTQEFFPALAGAMFSEGRRCWEPTVNLDKGYANLVVGFGTQVVGRGKNNPHQLFFDRIDLNGSDSIVEKLAHGQKEVEVFNLNENRMNVIKIEQYIEKYAKSLYDRGLIRQANSADATNTQPYNPEVHKAGISLLDLAGFIRNSDAEKNFDLAKKTVDLLEKAKDKLTEKLGRVDVEFTVNFIKTDSEIKPQISIVQCRPQAMPPVYKPADMPTVNNADILYSSQVSDSNGTALNMKYLLIVDQDLYQSLGHRKQCLVAELVGLVNQHYDNTMLMAPGRWGSSSPAEGVSVNFSQINKARVLGEMTPYSDANTSGGSHFMQQADETGVHVPPIVTNGDTRYYYNRKLISKDNQNLVLAPIPSDEKFREIEDVIRLIDIPASFDGKVLNFYENRTVPSGPRVLIALEKAA